jgi:hypothetical protein
MTLLTIDQFKTYFEMEKDSMILSPQVAMIANLFDYNNFDYQSTYEIIEPIQQYSNVLIDVTDQDKFPGVTFGHIQQWFKYSMKFVKEGGRLQAKFPPQVVLNLINQNLQVNKIYLSPNECFVDIQNESRTRNTTVSYSTGEVLDIDLNNESVLYSYDESAYNYIKNVGIKYSVDNITFSGHDVATKLETTKEKAKQQNKFGLVIYNNVPLLRVEKLEETNVSSGSNCYLFDSEKERDSYYNKLYHPKVVALAKNLAYNQTMRIKVQSYLLHPSIFNYAV